MVQWIHTPTDHSADDEDTEPDNNACKRQRKIYTPADTIIKDMTKQRQAQLLKTEHIGLQHSQKIIGIILMILIIPEHKSLKVKHLTLIKLRIPKRVKEPLEHIMMLGCQMILHWIQTLKMKIS